MRSRSIGAAPHEYTIGQSKNPRRLMLTSIDAGDTGVLALVAAVDSPQDFVYMCIGDGRKCSMFEVAQVISLFVLDSTYQVLHPQFMPTGPPVAVLLSGGVWRHSRRKTFAPWIEAEIRRVAVALLVGHGDYVKHVLEVLAGEPVSGFQSLPSDFIFTDHDNSARLGPAIPDLAVDLSHRPGANRTIRSDQIAQIDYERDRYMAHLTREQLAQRTMDIVSNVHIVDDHDRISLDAADPVLRYWFNRLAEIQSEMRLRYGQYPAGWSVLLRGLEFTQSLLQKDWKFHGPLPTPLNLRRPFLIKYGERRYLEPMVEFGAVRVSPASSYNDSSLNAAIRDDELTAQIEVGPRLAANLARFSDSLGRFAGSRKAVTMRLETDYYVYCASNELSSRIAHDFKADCAVLVRDPEAFASRMNGEMKRRLSD